MFFEKTFCNFFMSEPLRSLFVSLKAWFKENLWNRKNGIIRIQNTSNKSELRVTKRIHVETLSQSLLQINISLNENLEDSVSGFVGCNLKNESEKCLDYRPSLNNFLAVLSAFNFGRLSQRDPGAESLTEKNFLTKIILPLKFCIPF